MEINNLDLIIPYLEFSNENEFYFIQILKRRKENPNMKKNVKLVKTFHIFSEEHLLGKIKEIQDLCNFYNARAYIDLNKKDLEKTATLMLKKLSNVFINKDYHSLKSIFDSSCGEHSIEKERKWLIDVDTKDILFVRELVENIEKCESSYSKIFINFMSTLNGYHLITYPFNVKELQPFQCEYPYFEVLKNCNVLLYYKN